MERPELEIGKMYSINEPDCGWWFSSGANSKERFPSLIYGDKVVVLEKKLKDWIPTGAGIYEYKILGPNGLVGWIIYSEALDHV